MFKHLITATSFALGGAGVAFVAHLAIRPYAFTRPMTELPPVAARTTAPLARGEIATIGPPIVLAETRITTSRAGMKRRVLPARLDPCSEWSDVSPQFVDETSATVAYHTHISCPRPGDER